MILELLAATLLLGLCSDKNDNKRNSGSKKGSRFSGEREYSLFDRYGEEHVVNEDGYCEDCDEYHDDW